MVESLVNGLPTIAPEIDLQHVNLSLSSTSSDIGRWQPGKLLAAWRASSTAIRIARHHGCDALYYVPAPGKRIALWRDLLILNRLRPIVPKLILHWHASGLGGWVDHTATALERKLAHATLDHADLSIVLGQSLKADAARFHPHHIEVVRNGIEDPCPQFTRPQVQKKPLTAVFLSECSAPKGLFRAWTGVEEANRRNPGSVRLVVAGNFPDQDTANRFAALSQTGTTKVSLRGFLTGHAKNQLLVEADFLVFPTTYEHETQGLVVAEAMAFDLPVIVSRWRAVHENLPPSHHRIISPEGNTAAQIADAIQDLATAPPPQGAVRAHFQAHYQRDKFLHRLATILQQ